MPELLKTLAKETSGLRNLSVEWGSWDDGIKIKYYKVGRRRFHISKQSGRGSQHCASIDENSGIGHSGDLWILCERDAGIFGEEHASKNYAS